MTPGARSTEFWMHAVSFLCGVILVAIGVDEGRDVVVCAGACWAGASALGYGHGRSVTKAPRPYLPPASRL